MATREKEYAAARARIMGEPTGSSQKPKILQNKSGGKGAKSGAGAGSGANLIREPLGPDGSNGGFRRPSKES